MIASARWNDVSLVGGDDAERCGEVCLAGAGRSEQDDVARFEEERPRCQLRDLLPDGGLLVPVEVFDGLDRPEPGRADPQPGAGGVAGGHFAFEDGGEVVLERPARAAGLLRQPARGLEDAWCFQRAGEVGELLGRLGLLRRHQNVPPIPNARS